jgi:carboxylesterase
MRYLAERMVSEGYTVYVPRLPGHGTNRKDFLQSNWQDWLREAVDAYLFLKSLGKPVYVCGLSMGGVLALLIAEKFFVPRLCLCAPALLLKNRIVPWTPLLKYFVKTVARPAMEFEEDYLKYLYNEYWSVHLIEKLADLSKLQKTCKKHLEDVSSDCLIIVSNKDNLVPVEVSEYIKNNTNVKSFRKRVFEESGHVIVNDSEKMVVCDTIIEWLKTAAL